MPLMRVPLAQSEDTVITAPFLLLFVSHWRIFGRTALVMIDTGNVFT